MFDKLIHIIHLDNLQGGFIVNRIKYFTQEELKRIFKSVEKTKNNNKHWLRDLCIFRVAYRCGLRVSEIGLLQRCNYNSLRGEIYCQRLKGSQNNTIRLDKETVIFLNSYIREYKIEHSDTLFKSQEKRPISRQMLDKLIKKYCSYAKINDNSKWHFHSLKHSIAVHLAESGLDIKEVQYYIGHKNVNNTLIYFQFTTAQQEQMYKKLEKSKMLV
ncbi:MAG: tyrosine-type recombinase/integrase [Firmicutes bacterium]|nr:tyrosine-type recombinase/integrase [Bacillota bacterium]